jgi:hypothetical protein
LPIFKEFSAKDELGTALDKECRDKSRAAVINEIKPVARRQKTSLSLQGANETYDEQKPEGLLANRAAHRRGDHRHYRRYRYPQSARFPARCQRRFGSTVNAYDQQC